MLGGTSMVDREHENNGDSTHGDPDDLSSLRSTDPALADLIDSRLSLSVLDADHLVELMTRVAELAVEHIAGADHAGITVVLDTAAPLTVGPTDERVEMFDRSQYELGVGPCLLAAESNRFVDIDLPEMTRRWPDLAEVSRACGISRVFAAPLHRYDESVGSLNLYTDSSTAVVVASTSPVLRTLLERLDSGMDDYSDNLAAARHVELLRSALEDRATIEFAGGIIVQSRGCSHDEAKRIFDAVAGHDADRRRSVAERIVADRELQPDV
ncbi:ANTAR domain-containing protein [Rhodococcus fascians]|uniref:ANTAR domain-containing protein n=1 Tax=Rhodococcoides fascians TaxID=1828 RepID=UPI00195C95E7|nr:ANTAR domain-containing protein [Rhodococcus fascians]MBM7241928.1 ANTAR domain-containing protein [Rhodococcus fascians]MBY3808632.1 ANTAR domain-containing protein [Rhodococcus fascians]MBY3840076.1 ANTAR domain-containing protein [Rhodococcus fascians]MBY3845159.1 ANTAR domain-containing protein [Rhodococcus fascians]MBY3848723.1 ANTAR domain-containing protein [Rhodococcus fascians]